MPRLSPVLLALALALALATGPASANPTNKGCVWMDGEPDYFKFEWDLRENDIEVTLTGRTNGWLSLGISLDGTMTSKRHRSDIMIGWVDQTSGQCSGGCVQDYASETYERPSLDSYYGGTNDLHLVRANQADGETSITFTRALVTQDPFDEYDKKADRSFKTDGSTMHFLWAMGNEDPVHPGTQDGEEIKLGERFVKHFARGSFDINLLETYECSKEPPKELVTNEYTSPDGTYSMSWSSSPDHKTVEITMTALTIGWLAVGFSQDTEKPAMPGADMVVGWVSGNGEAFVYDMYAPGYQMPELDVQRSDSTGDIQLVSASQDNGITKITFSRPANTGDEWSDVEIIQGDMTALWAYSYTDGVATKESNGDIKQVTMNKHDTKGMIKTNFFHSKAAEDTYPISNTVRFHALFMFMSWAVLAPIGVWLARYYKADIWCCGLGGQKWFTQHVIIQSLSLACMCVGLAIVVYARRTDIHFDGAHEKMGLTIFILALMQPILGYLADKWWNPNRVEVPVFPDKIHWYIGRIAMFLAIVNVGLGMELYHVDQALVILYSLGVTLVGLYWIYREILFMRRNQEYHLAAGATKAKHSSTPKWIIVVIGTVAIVAGFLAMYEVANKGDFMDVEAPQDLLGQDGVLCDDCFEIKAQFDKYPVPSRATAHVCLGFELDVSTTYHLTEFSHIIGNEGLLHHMVLYRTSEFHKEHFECLVMPTGSSILFAWAPGVERVFKTPPRAGFRAGRGTDTQYLLLQMHYVNPSRVDGETDSSGVHMVATTRLREYDSIVIFIGVMNNQIRLPPGKMTEVAADCNTDMNSDDFKTAFAHKFANSPYDTLNIFAFGLHAHDHGRKIRTEHWRGGRRLPRLGEDVGFDWENQKLVNTDVEWRLGDHLITHCVFDTRMETEPIIGGGMTGQEMCQNFVAFYPKIQASSCVPPILYEDSWMWGEWTPEPEDTW